MKTITFLILGLISSFTFSQYCNIENRFTELEYFNSDQISTVQDTTYAIALNADGEMQSLEMDFYYPSDTIDTLDKRPFILLIHGGAFYLGDKTHFSFECEEFAKRGFVCATMEYRLGKASDSGDEVIKRQYRARQDAHAAFRWIVENANRFKIDTDAIFIGGLSAGSFISHDLIYSEQSEWTFLFSDIVNELGPHNTSGNDLTNNFEFQGFYNTCGGTLGFNIDNQEMLPTVAFHKEYDQTVEIDQTEGLFPLYGSRKMHELLEDNGICSQLTVDTTSYDGDMARHCPYTDWQEIISKVSKASCFFKNILCETCDAGYSEELIYANCSATLSFDELAKISIQIFPNPAEDLVFIEGLSNKDHVTIVNVQGQVMNVTMVDNQIQTRNLPSGLYLIAITNHFETKSIPLIIK
jgi:hypothetical protein